MTLAQWVEECGTKMKAKGFHDDYESGNVADEVGFRLMLVVTEVVEAVQLVKKKMGDNDECIPVGVASAFELEMADIGIRILDLAWLTKCKLTVGDMVGALDNTELGELQKACYNVQHARGRHTWIARKRFRKGIGCQLLAIASGVCSAGGLVSSHADNGGPLPEGIVAHLGMTLSLAFGRLLDLSDCLSLDLAAAMSEKMAQNMERPFRYGTSEEKKP